MALTSAEQIQLDNARAALARATDGTAVKSVQHGSRRLENHAPDPAALERQIAELERKACGGRRRGALSFRIY